jgi:DNA repair exonuclease SbcCD ATPase subunit
MKKTVSLIIAVIFLTPFSSAHAETKTFIKEYTYQASEFDSKASCRTIALEQVKRLLLEELGTYLENNTEVKNFELTKDKITALTTGIVQTQVLDEKWDGKYYWLRAEIKADPENVAKSIDNLRKDQKKSDDLEEMVKKHEEALKEIDKLRSDIELLKNNMEAQEKFNKSIDTLTKEEKASANIPSLAEDQSSQKKKTPPVARAKRSSKNKVASTSTDTAHQYIASNKAKKYHRPDCQWAKKIKPENMVTFSSAKEARQAGYVPCKVCKPPISD